MDEIRPKPSEVDDVNASAEAEERRRHRRYDAGVNIRFRDLQPTCPNEAYHLGQTMNICHSGMFIKANCFYRLGTLLDMHVDILTPENELRVLKLIGRVAWISFEESLPGMGVEFRDLDEETRRALLAHTYRGELQFLGPDCPG